MVDLTYRQNQIAELLSIGASNKMIARHLRIAVGTVKVHVRLVLSKLGCQNRTQAAVVWATRREQRQ